MNAATLPCVGMETLMRKPTRIDDHRVHVVHDGGEKQKAELEHTKNVGKTGFHK